MVKILIVDDDSAIRRTLELHLGSISSHIFGAGDLKSAREEWKEKKPDIVLLDMLLPDGNGIELLEEAIRQNFGGLVVNITGSQDMELATEAMRLGAYDYLMKPLDIDQLDLVIERALKSIKLAPETTLSLSEGEDFKSGRILGRSPAVLELHKQIGLASRCFANVLIRGETGSGKELVARSIHRTSRSGGQFVAVNCSAIVPTLMESELFGHEKGAFTGAISSRAGQFEIANNGTIFLDEIGDLSLDLQVKLLRVLQEREFKRVGGQNLIRFSARVITATHRDLEEMIKNGTFRQDLYYRLKVLEINIPPLRSRREDIPVLVTSLLSKINEEVHRQVIKVPASVMQELEGYDWPGNIRELENRLTAAVVRSPGEILEISLPQTSILPSTDWNWNQTLEAVEKFHIGQVLEKVEGHLGRACEILGISRPTLRKKINDYDLRTFFKEKNDE